MILTVTNCFPSLHVGLVNLTYQILRNVPEAGPPIIPALRESCVDICRATLATRQHSIVDVIGGIALSEQTYHRHFAGGSEDLLGAILPELADSERDAVKALIEECDELPVLLSGLLALFEKGKS